MALCIRADSRKQQRRNMCGVVDPVSTGGSLLNYDCQRAVNYRLRNTRCTLIFVVVRLGGFNQSPDLMWRRSTRVGCLTQCGSKSTRSESKGNWSFDRFISPLRHTPKKWNQFVLGQIGNGHNVSIEMGEVIFFTCHSPLSRAWQALSQS